MPSISVGRELLASDLERLARARRRDRLRRRVSQELRDHEDDDPLKEAGDEKRVSVALSADQPRDDRDEERGAAAESRRHDAGRQAASILEPLQRRSDRRAVDERRAHSGGAVEDVQHRERRGVAEAGPAQAAQQSCGADEAARAETIDQPPVERLDPRLKEDEQRERELNVGELPARAGLHRLARRTSTRTAGSRSSPSR